MLRDVAAFLYGGGLFLAYAALTYAFDRICQQNFGFSLEKTLKQIRSSPMPMVIASAVVVAGFALSACYYVLLWHFH